MLKTARTLWAGFCLMCGVIFAALFLPVFLLTVGVFVGVPVAIKSGERSTYWQRAWVGFDRWCNVMLGGVITETISSRLGKTKLYGCKPVFWTRWADLLVGWWLHQIDHNHVEKSVNLAALVTDDNNAIDWDTLRTTPVLNGAFEIDATLPYLVNLDYSGTDYTGSDSFTFTVSDANGGVSNTGTVTVTVQSSSVAAGVISGGAFTRGENTTITMSNYTPALGVEVYIKDTANAQEYKCAVISNTTTSIVFNAPVTIPALSAAQVVIKQIIAWV